MMIWKRLVSLLALMAINHHSPMMANVNSAIELHGIKAESINSYNIVGPDPYFILTPVIDAEQPNFIVLNFKLDASNRANKEIPMELFFKSPATPADSFDPFYKLKFKIDSSSIKNKGQSFALAIPNTLQYKSGDRMRLDIDKCRGCLIEILAHPQLVGTPSADTVIVKPHRILDGLTAVDSKGRGLATLNWRLKGMSRADDMYTISGGDPYIISPLLDSATDTLGGVYVELVAISNSYENHDFQLFYATEFHGFIERASTFVSAKLNDSNTIKFVIPLDFLNSGHPKRLFLERIRLDFPQDQLGSKWRIEDIALIHNDQMPDLQKLIPNRRLENKFHRPSKLKFIAQIIGKVTSDLGFTMGYLLLLFLTGLGFWRAFRK